MKAATSSSGTPAPGLLEELLDDLEKRYKSPSPDVIPVKARVFERLLHRYVLLFAGMQSSLLGLIALGHLGQLAPGTVTGVAIGGAALSAAFAYRWRAHDEIVRAALAGTALAFLLLAAAVQADALVAAALVVALAAVVVVLVTTDRLPQGAVFVFAAYLPTLCVFHEADAQQRLLAEALALLPMLAVFSWRRLKTAATGAIAGAIVIGTVETALEAQSARVALAWLLAFFVLVGAVYEMRIRFTAGSRWREFVRIGVPVGMVYLLVASIEALPDVTLPLPALPWLAAAAICAYQFLRIRADRPSLPLRLCWAAISIVWAVLAEDALHWVDKQLLLLGLAAALQVTGMRIGSRFVCNLARVLLVGLAVDSIARSGSRFGPNIAAVGALTFAALVLAAERLPPVAATAAPAPGGLLALARRLLLVALGLLLRLPLLAWAFTWMRTSYQWLRYFRSSEEPLSLSDLLFCAAHAYGVTMATRQVLHLAVALGASGLQQQILAALVPALWGAALLASSLRDGLIHRRMMGVLLMIVPALFQAALSSDAEPAYFAWLALSIGAVSALASWALLRFARGHGPAGPA